jgi:hypothetical protein
MILANNAAIGLLSAAIALVGILISLAIQIYGDDIRAFCRRPELRIVLPDLCGEWTVLSDKSRAIYFHAIVHNNTPTRIAKSVELFVIDCVVTPEGQTPRRQPLPCPLPVQARREFDGKRHTQIDIGSTKYAYDLFRCNEGHRFSLLLNGNCPNNFKPWLKGPGTIEVAIEATGLNANSNKLFAKIAWDGVFPEERDGLEPHIRITQKTT